jgi:predicted transcriptional regulator
VLAAAAAALAWGAKYASTGGLWTLYSRLNGQELLENENRKALLKIVRENPGAPISELSDAVGLGWGATVYHLERLEAEGYLASQHEGKRRCFYCPGTQAAEDALGLLRDERARAVAEQILEDPGATQSDVADGIATSSATVHRRVEKLADADLVEANREGRCVEYRPTERLETLLDDRARVPA